MQPVSGENWTKVSGTAAGTTTVATRNCTLASVVIPSSKTGTVTIYDNGSGAASGNFIEVVNDSVDFPTTLPLNLSMKKGITAVVGGTTSVVITWH